MAATLNDVAQRVGVSPATVSRVLNGADRRVSISATTRARVRAAAHELGYRPNLTARSLSQGRTRTIGVVLAEGGMRLHGTYSAMIMAGISSVLAARGYATALYFSEFGRSHRGPNHASLLQDGRVDGGLIVDSFALDDQQVAELEREASRFPFVLIGHRLPESRLHWLAADDRSGAAAAVDHLLRLGHRRIVHLCNLRGQPVRERWAGYQQALAAHQLEARPEWLVPCEVASGMSEFVSKAASGMGKLWAGREPPTAVFAWNDHAALAAMQVLHEIGLTVPREVSVVGYDDFEVAALTLPALTTVREPLYKLGALAAEVLLDVVPGSGQPVQRLLPTALVVRKSTGPAPLPGRATPADVEPEPAARN